MSHDERRSSPSMLNWIFQTDANWEVLLCAPPATESTVDDTGDLFLCEVARAEARRRDGGSLSSSQHRCPSNASEARTPVDVRNATSFTHWFVASYIPCVFGTFAYVTFLGCLGAIRPSDWMNGAAWIAVGTTPLIFTIVLAVVVSPPS